MAAVTAAAVSLRAATTTSTSPSSAPQHSHCSFPSAARTVVSRRGALAIRAQAISTDAAAAAPVKEKKVSKKQEEGVVTNTFRPKEPYVGKCLLNTKITADDAPGETWHMVFSTEGAVPYKEGQSIGVVADGEDKNGKPHKLRLYSIASSALGDFGDAKTVSLCVKRLVYTNDAGEVVKGVCSNFLCDLKPGADVNITGPVGKEMLMPKDPNATIIMLATGTGIAPFRSFLWKMFFEKYDDYKFNGLAWLFLGVPTSSSLLYPEEFGKMKAKAPDNFRVDYAISREETNAAGEKMYIQTRMAEYKDELWELLKKDNTYVYMCGLKGMEKGIDEIMVPLAAKEGIDWIDYRKQLKKSEQWNVEVY
ncbi:ferredoxin--NADP reductase, leaf isozyme 1, chloroplastic-like [Hordeum vulgare subsp. vulgare]|uniref:Ferredoxin--NADP reductase, chloroplastic n=1 Tax=Hordeum vulgare subsp. vulgare TaxID=112509 RepID=A0A8I7BCY1_HORVV|nr:ferredoxin--NADP reductase, leaf isozyme 1, chloroplastic-like [Hordeum vulgare subsp. vulgare]KAI4974281.1 hypothetical protein ZWY2020_047561 [Hordeum vulgare]